MPPPEIPPRDISTLKGNQPLSGAKVANLSPALAEELSLNKMRRGVIVLGTYRRSPARRLGIRPGDIIVEINGKKVDYVATLIKIVVKPTKRWRIRVKREDKIYTADVEG